MGYVSTALPLPLSVGLPNARRKAIWKRVAANAIFISPNPDTAPLYERGR